MLCLQEIIIINRVVSQLEKLKCKIMPKAKKKFDTVLDIILENNKTFRVAGHVRHKIPVI